MVSRINPDRDLEFQPIPEKGDLRFAKRTLEDGKVVRILQRFEWCQTLRCFSWFDVPEFEDGENGRPLNS